MMRSSGLARRRNSRLVRATLLTWVVLAATAASAAAQMNGDLRYVRGYDLITNPPTTHHPTTLILYGVYPTDVVLRGIISDVLAGKKPRAIE